MQEEKETCRRQDRQASAPPVRRASCVWGDIWDLRNLLSMKRKFSASSSDCQVRLLRQKGLCLSFLQEEQGQKASVLNIVNLITVDSSISQNFSTIARYSTILKVKTLKSEIDHSRFSTIEGFSTILQSTISGFYCIFTTV